MGFHFEGSVDWNVIFLTFSTDFKIQHHVNELKRFGKSQGLESMFNEFDLQFYLPVWKTLFTACV